MKDFSDMRQTFVINLVLIIVLMFEIKNFSHFSFLSLFFWDQAEKKLLFLQLVTENWDHNLVIKTSLLIEKIATILGST